MALEGTIKDFGLPDIFQLIGLQRKTGILTLTSDNETVTVTFENGMVVMADSSSKRLEDRLGNVLVKQGKLSKERLDEALETQKQTLQRLGHILTTERLHHGQGPEGRPPGPGLPDRLPGLPLAGRPLPLRPHGQRRLRPRELRPHERGLHPDGRDPDGGRVAHHREEDPVLRHRVPRGGGPVDDRGGGREATTARRRAPRDGAPPAPRARSASPPRRSGSSARWTARAPCRPSSTPRGWASSRSAASLFDFLNRNIIAPAGRGEARRPLGRRSRSRSPPRLPATSWPALVVLLVARRHLRPAPDARSR